MAPQMIFPPVCVAICRPAFGICEAFVRRNSMTIQRTKVHEQLVELLMDDITQGRYALGEQLPAERELMETYGVGRPAVREAIAKLALMGVVDVQPGVRARVRQPTLVRLLDEMDAFIKMFLLMPGGIEHLQQARIMFETILVRHAAQNRTEEQMQALAENLKRSERSLDDTPVFAREDVHFHSLFAEFTGNPLLMGLNNALGNWLTGQRTVTLATEGQSTIAYAAHVAIFKAVQDRDEEGAERALRTHLDQVHSVWFKNSKQP